MSSTKEEIPTPFEKAKEIKNASASKEAVDSKNTSPTKEAVDSKDAPAPSKASRVFREKRHNVLVVRQGMKFRTLVIMAKNMLKNQFETIELHGVDDQSYLTITLVTQCLLKYKYVTLERLKTKTHQTWFKKDEPRGKDAKSKSSKAMDDADSRIVLQPKLVMHLKKSSDFNKIYDDFEALHSKDFEEEHKEEIEMDDKNAEAAEQF